MKISKKYTFSLKTFVKGGTISDTDFLPRSINYIPKFSFPPSDGPSHF